MLLTDIISFYTLRLMPKRNTILSLIVMPLALLLWFIAWSLYWIGSKKEPSKLKPFDQPKQAMHTLMVPTPEQQYAT